MRIDTGYRPRAHQRQIHAGLKRFSVLVCHRRFGKTVLSINSLIDAAARCKLERPRYGYIAPEYKQAKTVAWDYLKDFTRQFPGIKTNESELWVELPNGAKMRLFGADNPDSLRGVYWDGVVLDEVAQMKPYVWEEIIRPALVDREGWALFIGTPKGMNLFSELYQRAIRSDDWYAGMFRASETGIVPEAELAEAKACMSDDKYAQEFECDFSASMEDSLISTASVDQASVKTYPAHTYQYAPSVLGVDVARFGDDKSVLITRKGLVAYDLRKYQGLDTMQLSDIVSQAMTRDKHAAVFIDSVGIGAGVVDRLRQLGYRPIDVNAGSSPADEKYFNKRAEMWCLLRDWIEDGGAIPNDLELKADLVSCRYFYDLRNRICIEKKEDMKKRGLSSPDCAEALALTFAQPVRQVGDLERLSATRAKSSYDPMRHFA